MKSIKNIIIYILLTVGIFTAIINLFTGVFIYNCDNYFMFAHARELLKNGFVSIDPIRMHEGLNFVYTQWIFAALLWLLKSHIGNTATAYLVLPFYAAIYILLYKIGKLITDDNKNSLLFATISSLLFTLFFSALRPYICSAAFGLALVYCFEKYEIEGGKKYLIALPVISILQINFHNSLWIGLILICFCYLGEDAFNSVFKHEKIDKNLWISFILVCLGSLINPYGIKYITWIFSSMQSLKELKPCISELWPLLKVTPASGGKLIIIAIFIQCIYIAVILLKNRATSIPIRYLLMSSGFLIMTLMAKRNAMYLFSAGQILFLYLARFSNILLNEKVLKRILLACGIVFIMLLPFKHTEEVEKGPLRDYTNAIDYIENIAPDRDTKIFTYNDPGSYLAYKGYKPYIDAMAELYGIEVNKKKDISKEFLYEFNEASPKEFSKFLDEYGFQYVICDDCIDYKISPLKNWEKIYNENDIYIYKRK